MTDRFAKIIAMTILGVGLLAFPAIGLWKVAGMWPAMTVFDRSLFCLSAAAWCACLPYVFWRGLGRVRQGLPAELLRFERLLIWFPISATFWIFSRSWGALLLMAIWIGWDVVGDLIGRKRRTDRNVTPTCP